MTATANDEDDAELPVWSPPKGDATVRLMLMLAIAFTTLVVLSVMEAYCQPGSWMPQDYPAPLVLVMVPFTGFAAVMLARLRMRFCFRAAAGLCCVAASSSLLTAVRMSILTAQGMGDFASQSLWMTFSSALFSWGTVAVLGTAGVITMRERGFSSEPPPAEQIGAAYRHVEAAFRRSGVS
jgi:hypothetical protein